MSAHVEHEQVVDPPHGHGDDVHVHHGGFKDYLIGFGLAVVLTAIPFWIVMSDVFRSTTVAAVVILLFAAVQIVVHMVYFLHMNTKSEGGWTFLALMFTAVMVVITLTGSLWVMHHLDSNMMPMSPAQMRNMP
ncbi:cytochrome o ubiquinol oxidase subunit IV [Azospirillum sp. sgz302134]